MRGFSNARYQNYIIRKLVVSRAVQLSSKVGSSSIAVRTALEALDSAANSHFLPDYYKGTDHQSTHNGILVGCANESVMRAIATDRLNIRALLEAAKRVHKFKKNEITLPLVSVPQLCDSDMDVHFTKT